MLFATGYDYALLSEIRERFGWVDPDYATYDRLKVAPLLDAHPAPVSLGVDGARRHSALEPS